MILAATTSASAQISLSSAADLALRSDPRVQSAQAAVDSARAGLKAAEDAYIPSVGISGGYGSSTGVPLSVPVVFQLSSQSLLFNFSQRDNLRAASSGLNAAELSLQEIREKVAEDIAVTYIDLNSAQLRQAALEEEYGFASRLVTIVQERLDAGQDTRLSLLKARRTADQVRLDQLQTNDEVDTLEDHLARLIGLPGNQLRTNPSSIPAFPAVATAASIEKTTSPGVEAAFANARSKQEVAFGDSRYLWRPQVGFGASYSRISTTHTSYSFYYPVFAHDHSDNSLSVGIQIQIPLFDRAHEARAKIANADARRAFADAEDQRNQFLEGRAKLQHNLDELSARSSLAEDERDLAQEQLNATLTQLQAASGSSGGHQLSPEDEQNARIQASARSLELLNAQLQLNQAQINLLRQTGQLDAWLKQSLAIPDEAPAVNIRR